jgi:hypothetical protein
MHKSVRVSTNSIPEALAAMNHLVFGVVAEDRYKEDLAAVDQGHLLPFPSKRGNIEPTKEDFEDYFNRS